MPVVTQVRKANSGGHKHITHVQTRKGNVWTREDVYDSIQAGRKKWRSYGGGAKARIEALDECPDCDEEKFIRSHPDASKKDNLDNLPTF